MVIMHKLKRSDCDDIVSSPSAHYYHATARRARTVQAVIAQCHVRGIVSAGFNIGTIKL